MNLEELLCQVDDFCQAFMPEWEATLVNEGVCQKPWQCQMSVSEIMTIMILFHQHHHRNFKHFYQIYVGRIWQKAFPNRR